jgi:hypothetical protein
MKKYLFSILHIIAFFLCYVAFGILIFWIFEVYIPLPVKIKNSSFVAIGTFFLLPIIGLACIKFDKVIKGNKQLGHLYLILWIIVVIRFVYIILTK